MQSPSRLLDCLKKGFYVDNLYEMARLCRASALDDLYPAPFFILQQIFLNIAREWEDIPVQVEEAKQIQSLLMQPISELLEAIAGQATAQEVYVSLNSVVSAYLSRIPLK